MGPSGETLSVTIDQGLVALIGLLALGACGLVAIALGVAAQMWPNSRLAKGSRQSFRRELEGWIGGAPTNGAAEAEVDRLARQFTALNGWSLIGMGAGMLMWTLGMAVFALATTGTLGALVGNGESLIFAVLFQVSALGLVLGFVTGTGLARRTLAAHRRPSYGDLRRRRPGDYRAGIIGWGPYLIAAYACVMCLLLAARGPRLLVTLGGVTWVLSAPLALGGLAALAALAPLATTVLVRWTAISPRAMYDEYPSVARGADDLRRALAIGTISGFAWQSCAWTLLAVASITSQNFPIVEGSPLTSPAATLLSGMWNIAFLLGMVAFMTGAIIMALRGRLGGRATHWRRPASPLAPLGLSPDDTPQRLAPFLAPTPNDAPHI